MKKLGFMSALCTMMVMMLTSCSGNEELLNSMVGTWTDNDPEENVTIQFYPSTDGHTGRFVERRTYIIDGQDGDSIELNISCNAFISGTYTLTDERRLIFKYDIDELGIIPDEDDMLAYAQRNIEYNNSHGDTYNFSGYSMEEVVEHLTDLTIENEGGSWEEFYTSENKDFESSSYSDVKVDGNTFSYGVSGNQRVVYTRVDKDMFDADFFDETPEEEAEAEAEAAE